MATRARAKARPPLVVRQGDTSEDKKLADVLSRSFWDDPVTSFMMPDDRLRYTRQMHFFKAELYAGHRRGEVLTTNDQAGVSIWLRPGQWKTPTREMLRMGPTLVAAIGARIPQALKLLDLIEGKHPQEPHWYLAVLGTDPVRQGCGVGGALITEITNRSDLDGLACYLESSKEANVAYYERFGFKVTEEVHVPGGPTVWLMWRDPRTPDF